MAFTENFRQIEFNPDKEIYETFRATQGDTKSQGFNVVVFLGGKKKVITTETMSFFAQKPDGTRVIDTAVKDGDGFKIELKNQVFAVPGVVVCTLVLNGASGEKLADRQFKILVSRSMEDGAIISKDERGILDWAFEFANSTAPYLEDIRAEEEARELAETQRVQAETTRAGFYDGFDERLTDLETKTLKRYGVRRTLGATSPLLTRIYDSVGKTAQVPTDDGKAANDFDALFPWSRIRECKIKNGRIYYKNDPGYNALADCDWMVEIPKFYLRIEQTTTERDITISQYKHAGYWTPQVFKTETGAELDRIYVGRFKTGNIGGVDVSRPEIFPDNFRDLASFRAGAKSKGEGWQLIDLSYVQEVLHPLYMVESANLNSQDYLGNGITSVRNTANDLSKLTETATNRIVIENSSATYYNVGEDINIGTAQGSHNVARNRTIVSKNQLNAEESEIVFDGDSVDILAGHFLWQGAQRNGQTKNLTKPSGKLSGISGRTSIKYRGMEDVFGNVYEWVDGVLINDLTAHVCRKPSLYSSSLSEGYAPTNYINSDTNGYPLEMGWDENYPEARFPVSVGAGSTTGYSDYYYKAVGLRGVSFGGRTNNGSYAGLFFWNLLHPPSNEGWSIGSRLLFKPPV